ncbi:hypothetical protein LCGC14_1832620 [marine sediment metagenome]|uniref:Uncharacterized protein n=1 Tax=marine sediment metagenome TaxID=412755 RepID=A0A0F9GFT1_9ZZZZ
MADAPVLQPVLVTHGFGVASVGGIHIGNDVFVMTVAGAPTDGTSGTGAGWAGIGSILSDRTNGALYVNSNTKASPTWTKQT